ncbi:MAG: hypothetical protein H7Y86_00265 [Rhizobacter sp.]|nr:hypothetical protein [Ferruginibacter sp.]
MKFFLLVAGMLLTCFVVTAQDKEKLVGKWKIIVMYDSNMHFDVKKDSLYLKNDPKTKKQPASIYNQARAMMKELYMGAYIELKANMEYEEGSGIQGVRKGAYIVDEVNKIIIIKRERKSKATGELTIKEEKIPYYFKAERLVFVSKSEDDGPTVEFEKQ